MAQRKTLTEKQVALLRWIADGCPDGMMEDDFYRISAAALRSRKLVTISGRGPTWAAQITPAGREYLKQVDGSNPPVPRQGNVSVTQQLVDDVIAAGGSLRVRSGNWYEREGVDYEHRARLAQQYGRAPAGKRLTTRRIDGELEIRLEDAIPGTDAEVAPVLVPERITRLHPVAQRFCDDTDKHEVSRAQLSRCVRIIHALLTEAERRGYTVSNVEKSTKGYRGERWTGGNDGHLIVKIREHSYTLRVAEEKVSSRGPFDGSPSYLRPPNRKRYDSDATGRLQITSDGYGRHGGRAATWADRRSWTLEDKLPELLQELEIRAAEDDHREAERQRAAEERRRNWEIAMERAKQRFLEHHRAQVLRAQVAAWQEVTTIRSYLNLLEEHHGDNAESTEWIDWIRRYVDERLDPLASPPAMPAEPEIKPNDLKPSWAGSAHTGRRGGERDRSGLQLGELRPLFGVRRRIDNDPHNEDEAVTDSPTASRGDALGLPRALALNRFDVRCPSAHTLTRLSRPESRDARRELEARLGQTLFVTDDFAYAAGEVAEGNLVELGCDFDLLVHQFDLREALARQARERGFRTWFGRGGELHVVGLPGGRTIDGIDVQRRLRLRLTAEEEQTSLTVRHGTRWITASLSDSDIRSRAVGETAVRLDDGRPRRGEVLRTEGSTLVLRVGGDEIEAASDDYAISASAAYVRRHHGAQTLQDLQVESGSMTSRGQRNRYAVKDRFEALLDDMDALGWTISLGSDRAAVIEREWTEIRVQEGT